MASTANLILLRGEPEKEHRVWHITKPLPPPPPRGKVGMCQCNPSPYHMSLERGGGGRVPKRGWQIVHGADVCHWFLGGSTDSSVTEPCFFVFVGDKYGREASRLQGCLLGPQQLCRHQ
jgi:hypothetical protein